jgi:hypothetical protein
MCRKTHYADAVTHPGSPFKKYCSNRFESFYIFQ